MTAVPEADAARLTPGARALLAQAGGGPSLADLPLDQARAAVAQLAGAFGRGDDVAEVRNVAMGADGGLAGRVYRPFGATAEALPPLVYLHAGGWSTGDLQTGDALCRRLAARIGCVVLSVDYRLAPEHPFPAALEDVDTAARWLTDQAGALGARPGPVAVCGDSAGANLAAAHALRARSGTAAPVVLQVLLFGALDLHGHHPSQEIYGTGYFATMEELRMWTRLYAADHDRSDPLVSPLLAADLSGLPPAVVITAECDPTRDGAERYAARLTRAGVPVISHRFPGQVHDFVLLGDLVPESDAATTLIAELVGDCYRLTGLDVPSVAPRATGHSG